MAYDEAFPSHSTSTTLRQPPTIPIVSNLPPNSCVGNWMVVWIGKLICRHWWSRWFTTWCLRRSSSRFPISRRKSWWILSLKCISTTTLNSPSRVDRRAQMTIGSCSRGYWVSTPHRTSTLRSYRWYWSMLGRGCTKISIENSYFSHFDLIQLTQKIEQRP